MYLSEDKGWKTIGISIELKIRDILLGLGVISPSQFRLTHFLARCSSIVTINYSLCVVLIHVEDTIQNHHYDTSIHILDTLLMVCTPTLIVFLRLLN